MHWAATPASNATSKLQVRRFGRWVAPAILVAALAIVIISPSVRECGASLVYANKLGIELASGRARIDRSAALNADPSVCSEGGRLLEAHALADRPADALAVLADLSPNPGVLWERGWALEKIGDEAAAVEMWRQAGAGGWFLYAARRAGAESQISDAEAAYEKVLAIDPSVAAAGELGDLRRLTGDLAGAQADYVQAAQMSPTNSTRAYYRGMAAWAAGNPDEAQRELDAAIESDPTGPAPRAAADLARARGDIPTARTYLLRLLTRDPRDMWSWIEMGDLEASSGAEDSARADYLEARRVAPTADRPLERLGDQALRLGQYAEARMALRDATRLAPNAPDLWLLLGQTEAAAHNPAAARTAFRQVVAITGPTGALGDTATAACRALGPDVVDLC
jgi:tetratricopeptide (TPR) repeat protein